MIAAVGWCRRLCGTRALAACRDRETLPGADVETDDAILDYARGRGASVHHAVSSCRMGRDQRPVVDDRLRVHGLGALRVIDASVMPTMPSANTNAAMLMIAEKGADPVLADHRCGARRLDIGASRRDP